jgi:23S rRNA pseudouridine2605 synthase
VGRLDFNTGGLLLLTNAGTLGQKIAHPKHAVSKTYLVRIKSVLSRADVQNLERGVKLSDGWSKFDRVKIVRSTPGDSWLEVQLHSGKNRIVRRTFRALGFPVLDLLRSAIGPIKLGELKPGRTRVLSAPELSSLIG